MCRSQATRRGVLLLDYLIGAKSGRAPCRTVPVALKSLVTTDLARVVAEANGVKSYNTFTGFKFMAEKKNQLEGCRPGACDLLLRGVHWIHDRGTMSGTRTQSPPPSCSRR